MKEILQTYTTYNLWANTIIIELLKTHSSLLDKEVKSSFTSLRKTMHHIFFAEEIWHKRLHGESPASLPEPTSDFTVFTQQLLVRSQSYVDLVASPRPSPQGEGANNSVEKYLQTACSYKAVNGTPYTNPHWQMIMHCMNHSTYHRGQIITILRELGVTSLPTTDLMAYFRNTDLPADRQV